MTTLAQCTGSLKPSYIREILHAASSPGVISLAGGLPASDLFPMDLLHEAALAVVADTNTFQYGLTEGEVALRDWISSFHGLAHTECVLITTGSQQALDLIARAYLNPGDKVLVENPCYLGALQIFALAGVECISVDQQEDGPDLDQLASSIHRQQPKVFYAVPDFHNPTGVSWSLQKRRCVASLLNDSGVTFIEDSPYRALRYSGDELPQVCDLLVGDRFRLGSFSKTVAPGLRLGYVCGDNALIRALTLVKQASDLHSTRLTQLMTVKLLQSDQFPCHMANLQHHYKQRRDVLAAALEAQLGHVAHFVLPEGGMFIWLEMPGIDTDALANAALQHKVAVVPASAFLPPGAKSSAALRLNFSHSMPGLLDEAVKRLLCAIVMTRHQ